jgi:tight adherence protein C
MTAVLVLVAMLLLASAFVAKNSDPERRERASEGFAAAGVGERSALNRALLGMARPVSGLALAHLDEESSTYKQLRTKLAAAGNMYGGQVAVFVSVQVLATFLAALAFIAIVATDASGLMLLAGAIGGLALAAYPYNRVATAAKERMEEVNQGLPEFAELLLMPLSSGYGILPALDFTASRLTGPVADEVRLMLEVIQNRVRTEAQAFSDAADRLGTPAATSFFTALSQAYLDGVQVVETIRGQAEQLRKQDFERMREKLKALPNKLAIIMGLHLLPTLFIVVMFPTFATLSKI